MMANGTAVSYYIETFLSRCKPLRAIAEGKTKASAIDEKNFFWCAGVLSGILDGYRMGLLVKGDLDFAKSHSICAPENSTDVGLILPVLDEIERQKIEKSTQLATAVTAIFYIKWRCR